MYKVPREILQAITISKQTLVDIVAVNRRLRVRTRLVYDVFSAILSDINTDIDGMQVSFSINCSNFVQVGIKGHTIEDTFVSSSLFNPNMGMYLTIGTRIRDFSR